MRIVSILLLMVVKLSYANNNESLIVGEWRCDYYFEVYDYDLNFIVTNKIEFISGGKTKHIHIFSMEGKEDFFWFKTLSSGVWQIEGDKLTDKIISTKIIDGSIPEPITAKNLIEAIELDGKRGVSEITILKKISFRKEVFNRKIDKLIETHSFPCKKL
ncbi:hypothetical protein [Thalassotalea sp. G2M2-11]|uniref:hypothetical protein n=1 Tax=Thalassotalea sp. G2M2-11 TaxID=2787627 RepID=UPI0019D07292|nr:hypothetical protein [Thalassotalea sp. G2M2-11]